jgi:small GTP-binding protein
MEESTLVKIVVVGDKGTGKSAVCRRYRNDVFVPYYLATQGVEFCMKTLCKRGHSCKVMVWNTASEQRFREITTGYLSTVQAVLVLYDVTSQVSYDSLPSWLSESRRNLREGVPVFVVGTKVDQDQQRSVSAEVAREFCRNSKVFYMETSARTSQNIAILFEIVLEKVSRLYSYI